jgi:hypothetical protein
MQVEARRTKPRSEKNKTSKREEQNLEARRTKPRSEKNKTSKREKQNLEAPAAQSESQQSVSQQSVSDSRAGSAMRSIAMGRGRGFASAPGGGGSSIDDAESFDALFDHPAGAPERAPPL